VQQSCRVELEENGSKALKSGRPRGVWEMEVDSGTDALSQIILSDFLTHGNNSPGSRESCQMI
jgi:hypothetical protein